MEKFETKPYESTSLRSWLEKQTWTAKEAVCLLSDIEPSGAVISWDGFTNPYGGLVDLPKVTIGHLVSEGHDQCLLREGDRFVRKFGHPEGRETWLATDDLAAPPGLESEQYHDRRIAEAQLRRAWDAYRRNPKHTEDDRRPPQEFISWGIKQRLQIPWLEWAKAKGYFHAEGRRTAKKKDKKSGSLSKDDEVAELREAAVIQAVKLVEMGIEKKFVTVEKVCQRLLDSGYFSDRRPFKARWRSVEGMRDKLKNEHSPKADSRFTKASTPRQRPFNS